MNDRFIKRLWHTNKKCFIYEFSILQTVNSDGNFENTYFERDLKTLELKRLSASQIEENFCTGLKDKNGNLIYEGDVVDITTEIETIAKIEWSEDLARFTIHFENILCDFDNYNSTDLEVLGNIYEDKEQYEGCFND